jgi:hypothetical protein
MWLSGRPPEAPHSGGRVSLGRYARPRCRSWRRAGLPAGKPCWLASARRHLAPLTKLQSAFGASNTTHIIAMGAG